MYGVSKCSSFILLQVVDQFPQHHSSILAWRIPWTEGPGRLQSTESDMTEKVTLSQNSQIQRGRKQNAVTRGWGRGEGAI